MDVDTRTLYNPALPMIEVTPILRTRRTAQLSMTSFLSIRCRARSRSRRLILFSLDVSASRLLSMKSRALEVVAIRYPGRERPYEIMRHAREWVLSFPPRDCLRRSSNLFVDSRMCGQQVALNRERRFARRLSQSVSGSRLCSRTRLADDSAFDAAFRRSQARILEGLRWCSRLRCLSEYDQHV